MPEYGGTLPVVIQVTPGPYLKKWGLGGYADAKSPAGDCA